MGYDAFGWVIKTFIAYLICFHISSWVLLTVGKEAPAPPIPLDTQMFIGIIGIAVLTQIILMVMDIYVLKFKRKHVFITNTNTTSTEHSENKIPYPIVDETEIPYSIWIIIITLVIAVILWLIIQW